MINTAAVQALLYFHMLLLCYTMVLEPVFGDLYKIEPRAWERYIITLPMAVITALHIPNFHKPSDLALALMAIVPVLPAFCYYTLHGGSVGYTCAVFLGFLAFAYVRRLPVNLSLNMQIRTNQLIFGCVIILAIVIGLAMQGFRINSFSAILQDLYGVRAEVGANNTARLLNYLQGWAYSIIIPFLILYAWVKRRWMTVIGLFGLLFLFFLMLAAKSILINPVIVLVIYLALRTGRGFARLFLVISTVIAAASLAYALFDNLFIVSVFVRRTLYVPAMLNHHYHELFTQIGHVYYSHSVLSFFSDYPFEESYQSLVGSYVFGNPLSHANTGIFGTGYMHFGYAGVVLFPAVMGIILAFVDRQTISKSNPRFATALVTLPMSVIFTSADLFSGMLTNGFLVAILLLILCGNVENRKKKARRGMLKQNIFL